MWQPTEAAPAVSRAQVTCLVLQDSTKYILLLECAYTFRVLDIVFGLLWHLSRLVFMERFHFLTFFRVKKVSETQPFI